MTNKIYDFLPGHLRNKELETIFDATIERVFSKGNSEKLNAYVGRKERGMFKEEDIYISYPTYSYARKNYAFEPVFENKNTADRVFYDDFLNSLYNKGSITTDHTRLLRSEYKTLNLPIDIDKFTNYTSYYWVSPGFFTDVEMTSTVNKHYVTIDKADGNWWSEHNSWYHYDDISELITSDNSGLIEQARRPIIEFDARLELSTASLDKTDDVVEEPLFNLYDENQDSVTSTTKLFSYVTGDYTYDSELVLNAKMVAGNQSSEYVYTISVTDIDFFKIDEEFESIYVMGDFQYRNFRDTFENFAGDTIELSQPSIDSTADVYINGIMQHSGFSVDTGVITFDHEIEADYMYIDYKTSDVVDTDGEYSYQRIVPEIEFNIDNEDYFDIELNYTALFQHFNRIISTVDGIIGEPNASNNLRWLGDNSDKLRFASKGSVLVKRDIDMKSVYFAVTNDKYDPYTAIEFIANAYTSYKNKLIGTVETLLNDSGSVTKTDTMILEEALSELTRTKSKAISMFTNVDMISFGSRYSHYHENEFSVVPGSFEQIVPDLDYPIVDDESVLIYLNGVILKIGTDYTISASGNTVTFTVAPIETDTIVIKNFTLQEETYVPPSAVKLGIGAAYEPKFISDEEYDDSVQFILGHDGSKTPLWGNRIDSILLEFETRIWNKLSTDHKQTVTPLHTKHLTYAIADTDYTFEEKNFTLYPFFKKWMIKNNIIDLQNENYDVDDWKTWNYKSMNSTTPGSWRGLFEYSYGTDQPFSEPWKILNVTQKPNDFDATYGTDYRAVSFWENLIADSGADVEVPVDGDGNLRTIDDLFFNGQMLVSDIENAKADWEFGDASPVELAWRRSSDFPFIAFLGMILLKPVQIIDAHTTEIDNIVSYFLKRDGIDVETVTSERSRYTFNLGSKLAGFVNNVKVYTENNALSNSQFTEIPKDNYDVFVHNGEPNRSEFFSAIIIEKVSLDAQHPTYNIDDVADYIKGDVVFNSQDEKYYRRKVTEPTAKEQAQTIGFDYSAWVLISQPKTRNFGYRVHGYDDFNPTFYTLDWDTSSGSRAYSTQGDEQQLSSWKEGSYYRLDEYVKFNGQPYVCLRNHTATSVFSENQEDWKQLAAAPRTNVVTANGYNKTTSLRVKTHNYGDIVTIDEVAQLMIGYQEILKLLGWEFTDTDVETSEVVDFETLLYKFLDWTSEQREVGEFITLTPIVYSGSFTAPYGVASVKKETFKNFYRVLDASGRLVDDNQIKFYTNGDSITWESEVPVYGMKIDISDVEHAITFDREDSYGDLIYDPLVHDRNLRFTIDCNRTSDWDGTMNVDGFLVYGDNMIPNFETLVSDTRYYRDTLVDQNIEIINKLKARQIGFSPRTYLDNFKVDRESQLEFYKGFIAAKGTNESIGSIINNNSNYKEIELSNVWNVLDGDFGMLDTIKHATTTLSTEMSVEDPYSIEFDIDIDDRLNTVEDNSTALFKDAGYVDSKTVDYVVSGASDLNAFTGDNVYEGNTAWIQFDPERNWDVRRLSEIAEINYVGETEDGQLFVVLTNEVSTSDTVFLKINSDDIDPIINGYYYLIEDEVFVENGLTVYKYIVFEESFEPLTVEIDVESSGGIYVPTGEGSVIEAISTVSNPDIADGIQLVVDGVTVTYDDTAISSSGIYIEGSNALPNIESGDAIRLVIYDNNGNVVNTTTDLEFEELNIITTEQFNSVEGDKINIDGTVVTIQNSASADIEITSAVSEETNITSGQDFIIDGETFVFSDITVDATSDLEITTPRPLEIDGYTINFIPSSYPSVSPETTTEAYPISEYTVTSVDSENYTVTSVEVNDGVNPVYTLSGSDFVYDDLTGTITFSSAIADPDELDTSTTAGLTINLNPNVIPYTVQDMADEINIAQTTTGVVASVEAGNLLRLVSPNATITLTGSIIQDLGITTGTDTFENSKFENIVAEMQSLPSEITTELTVLNYIRIMSTNDTMTVGGTAANDLGISSGTYEKTSGPTLSSVVAQINAATIEDISAEVVGAEFIRITKSGSVVSVTEDPSTPGSMTRIGFEQTDYDLDAIDSIVEQINTVLFANNNSIATAYRLNDKVVITSTQIVLVLDTISGNPLSALGISGGTYSSNATTTVDAAKLRDQVNAAVTTVTASLTSDNRLIFTTEGSSIDFTGTQSDVLEALGLYVLYTTASSDPNFKVMRWKSVRYTPNVNGSSFDEFYSELGVNSSTLIWADEYTDDKWHVLRRKTEGTLEIIAKQSSVIDSSKLNKLLIQDDSKNFYEYFPYDPLNGVIPGEIAVNLDYITWSDPAKYDHSSNISIWLDEKVGELWWDTNLSRFYRYNDYGDANGIKDESFTKRYWGKLIPGSEVVLKKWTKSTTLPDYVDNYNSYTYWDSVLNVEVTNYYFWANSEDAAGNENDFTIGGLKRLVESDNLVNKFLPLNEQSIIVSSRKQNFIGDTLSVDLSYSNTDSAREVVDMYTQWETFSEKYDNHFSNIAYNKIKNDIIGDAVDNIVSFEIDDDAYNTEANYVVYSSESFDDLTVDDIVVSVDAKFIATADLSFDGRLLKIQKQDEILVGDVVRVYHVSNRDMQLFTDAKNLRNNFASYMNNILENILIDGHIPDWNKYVSSTLGVSTSPWYINDRFKTITQFEYLSRDANLDKLSLYAKGIKSFKIEGDKDEYYFEVDNALRLVHITESTLNFNFNIEFDIQFDNEYVNKCISVQIFEIFNMIGHYMSDDVRRGLITAMLQYLYSENAEATLDVIKTSEIDLMISHAPLQQNSIYQRDSIDDILDYVNETKPYHTKIRKVHVNHNASELVETVITDADVKDIEIMFGKTDDVDFAVADIVDRTIVGILDVFYDDAHKVSRANAENINIYADGALLDPKYYEIDDNGDLIFAPDSVIFVLSDKTTITASKRVSRYNTDILSGNGDITLENASTSVTLLDNKSEVSDTAGGIDTGLVPTRAKDSAVFKVETYTDETQATLNQATFYVYDILGRVWELNATADVIGTVSSVENGVISVNQASHFKDAKSDSVRMVAIENDNVIEFMTYDHKDGVNLTIKDRQLFNGIGADWQNGDKIYSLSLVTNQ